MNDPFRVYIGFDKREADAYEVAVDSLRRNASGPVAITPIVLDRNQRWGLISRPWRICKGSLWDVPSEAPQSTEFAISRFLTPILAQTGFALFVDSDVVFLGDVYELAALADPHRAIQCVQHAAQPIGSGVKMDGQLQLAYARKNWSSVMLFNCDHEAHGALTLDTLQRVPGRDLHRFFWCQDDEIGALPGEWNWLVGVQPKPTAPKLAHFTLGVPSMAGCEGSEHADVWWAARRRLDA